MIIFFLLLLGSIEGVSIRCDNEGDCQRFNTFCQGPYVCNQSAWCAPQHIVYDPCRQLRDYALSFSRDSRGEHVVSILCMEELRQCVELYYCITDSDCDDGLFCNGQERCIQGHCHGAATTTTTPCKACDESTRCGTGLSTSAITPTSDVAADTTTVYAIVGLSLITLSITVLFVLILIFRSVGP